MCSGCVTSGWTTSGCATSNTHPSRMMGEGVATAGDGDGDGDGDAGAPPALPSARWMAAVASLKLPDCVSRVASRIKFCIMLFIQISRLVLGDWRCSGEVDASANTLLQQIGRITECARQALPSLQGWHAMHPELPAIQSWPAPAPGSRQGRWWPGPARGWPASAGPP